MTLFTPASVLLSPLALLSMDEYHLRIDDILATLQTPDTTTRDNVDAMTVEKAFPKKKLILSYLLTSSLDGKETYVVIDEILCTAPLPF